MFQWTISPLVLQEFHVEEASPTGAGANLRIKGRPAGLINFLLTRAGLLDATTLVVDAVEVRLDRSSLFSKEIHVLPMNQVASVIGGVQSPIRFLFLAGVFSVWAAVYAVQLLQPNGLFMNLAIVGVCTVLAVTCAVLFILRKSFYLAFASSGGLPIIVYYQPNVIEGVAVDFEETQHALQVCRDLILQRTPSDAPRRSDDLEREDRKGNAAANARSLAAASNSPSIPTPPVERPAPALDVRPPGFGAPFQSPIVSLKTAEEPKSDIESPSPATGVEMEQITVSCPHCKKKLRIRTSQLGKQRTCPSCKQSFNA